LGYRLKDIPAVGRRLKGNLRNANYYAQIATERSIQNNNKVDKNTITDKISSFVDTPL
jgi:hypothetical protein